jgi:uncharacterized protein (TIRG00374 family)
VVPDPEGGTHASTVRLAGWRYRALFWSVLLAAAGYLGFSLWAGWDDVGKAVTEVGLVGVLAALALSLVNYGLRFARWQMYLREMRSPIPWRPSLWIYLAGFALTTTPAKAGEALRSVLLKRWHVPYTTSLAALMSERLSDVTAILILTLFGLAGLPSMQPLIGLGAALVVASLLGISSGQLLMRLQVAVHGDTRWAQFRRQILQMLLQARSCHGPRLLAVALPLSVVAWAAEAWALYLILHWMGLEVSLASAVFIYAISMLAGAMSFMPGGLGGAEAAMVSLLMWKGVGGAEAVAATILIRMATLWFAVAIGGVALARHHSIKDAKWREVGN